MKTLLFILLFALPTSLVAQANAAAYDQLMSLAGSQIAGGNLDAVRQTAEQALLLDSQQWRGNALMAAILQKQNDFTNAQVYIQKAIASAPADKKDKLNAIAQTIAASAAQGASAVSGGMSPEARIKYNALMLIAQDADKATLEDDRKQALREFITKSAAFLALAPDQTNVWVMRALTAVELDYASVGWSAGQKLKALGLENSDGPKAQKAFAELDRKNWLGDTPPKQDWSGWSAEQIKMAADAGDEGAQQKLADDQERQKKLQEANARLAMKKQREGLCGKYLTSEYFRADYTQHGSIIISPDSQSPNCVVVTGKFDCSLPRYKGVIEPTVISLENRGPGGHMASIDLPEFTNGSSGSTRKGHGWTVRGSFSWKGESSKGKSKIATLAPYFVNELDLTFGDASTGLFMTEWIRQP